ncbi:MAG: putative DNA binding domain-containing protein [Anaerolineales bacterium]|nr:putative DNA binding domain-containing protein [Anaerolineales bacterium]
MVATEPTLRKSPYIFILRTAAAELLFTFLLLGVALPISTRRLYEASPSGSFLSFDLLVVFIFTILQVLIIVAVFLSWYFPTYTIGDRELRWRRNFLNAEATLVKTQEIQGIEVKQGWLARRLDYGSLILKTSSAEIRLRNLPRPVQLADHLDSSMTAAQARQAAPLDRPLPALIAEGEGQYAEFKASLMWDYRRQSVNKDLYEPVMKNLVAFMNTAGGVLVIGVADDGQILGIEQDLSTLKEAQCGRL